MGIVCLANILSHKHSPIDTDHLQHLLLAHTGIFLLEKGVVDTDAPSEEVGHTEGKHAPLVVVDGREEPKGLLNQTNDKAPAIAVRHQNDGQQTTKHDDHLTE